eukprot:15463801-Alexandrium_andersonii.AAC.1
MFRAWCYRANTRDAPNMLTTSGISTSVANHSQHRGGIVSFARSEIVQQTTMRFKALVPDH